MITGKHATAENVRELKHKGKSEAEAVKIATKVTANEDSKKGDVRIEQITDGSFLVHTQGASGKLGADQKHAFPFATEALDFVSEYFGEAE